MKKFLIGFLLSISGVALAATFNLFSPATGVLKGNANTYVTTAASSADIAALWTGTCNSSTFLRGDGACAAASGGATLGSNTFTGNQTISKANPQLDYYSTSGTTDEHWWRTEVSTAGDVWRLAIVSDDGLTVLDTISATRFHNSIISINFAGPSNADDTFSLNADYGFGTQVSPSALSAGNNNDYNPGGSIGSRTYFRLTPDATGSNITGFQSTSSRKIKYLWNIGTTGNIVLKNNSGSSSAGNKILTPNALDYTVQPGGGWMMVYDGTSSVWRVEGLSPCLADGTGCTLPASTITSGTVAAARLGSGSPSSSTALFGDQTYKSVGKYISCTTACSLSGMAVGDFAFISKPSDTSRASTTTKTVDPDLQFTNVGSGVYALDGMLNFTDGGGGTRYQIFADTSCSATNGPVNGMQQTATATVQDVTANAQQAATATGASILGRMVSPSGNAIAVCWAQNSSNGANTTMKSSSFIRVQRVN